MSRDFVGKLLLSHRTYVTGHHEGSPHDFYPPLYFCKRDIAWACGRATPRFTMSESGTRPNLPTIPVNKMRASHRSCAWAAVAMGTQEPCSHAIWNIAAMFRIMY